MKPNAPSAPRKSSNPPPAAGAPAKDSPTSRSSSPTWTPPPMGTPQTRHPPTALHHQHPATTNPNPSRIANSVRVQKDPSRFYPNASHGR
jgi:hypothetical protein